jgi:hypothetical protein
MNLPSFCCQSLFFFMMMNASFPDMTGGPHADRESVEFGTENNESEYAYESIYEDLTGDITDGPTEGITEGLSATEASAYSDLEF